MTTEDEIRRMLHPEAHEPMPYNPRIPLGCDQQGRYPGAADMDELGLRKPRPEPWWPLACGVVVGVLLLVLVLTVPLGV